MIEETQNGSEEHLKHAENDRHLHLVRIEEENFVFGDLPDLEFVR